MCLAVQYNCQLLGTRHLQNVLWQVVNLVYYEVERQIYDRIMCLTEKCEIFFPLQLSKLSPLSQSFLF